MHNMADKETQIGEHKPQRKTNTDAHCTETAALPAPFLKLLLFYLLWHNITISEISVYLEQCTKQGMTHVC